MYDKGNLKLVGYSLLLIVSIAFMVYAFFPYRAEGYVAQLSWKSVVEIEEFSIVDVRKSSFRPPNDAYDTHHWEECTDRYNPTTKTTTHDCDTYYSWKMDRYVHVRDEVLTGINRSPAFKEVSLTHAEKYGNQRIGKQYVKYYATIQFDSDKKMCEIRYSQWESFVEGTKVKVSETHLLGKFCNVKEIK